MATEPRTLAPSTSTDSLHSRSRKDARTLTPTQSADSLHKSPSGRLISAPQLLEWVSERAHECRDDLQQLEEVAHEGFFDIGLQAEAHLDALPEETGRCLGQSRSSSSLLSVDSDNPTRAPIPPKRSAALDTKGVFQSPTPTQVSYSGLRAALQAGRTGSRTGLAEKTDARSSEVYNSSTTIRAKHHSNEQHTGAVDQSIAKVDDRQPIVQPLSLVNQSRSEPESPQKPRNIPESIASQGKMTTLIDHGKPQVVDIESAARDPDSNGVGPSMPVELKPPSSNGGQPTWVIEEVIDFGLPYEDQTRDCEDNFACKNLETSRGPMFERCGAGTICYDDDPQFFVPLRQNKESGHQRQYCWDSL